MKIIIVNEPKDEAVNDSELRRLMMLLKIAISQADRCKKRCEIAEKRLDEYIHNNEENCIKEEKNTNVA